MTNKGHNHNYGNGNFQWWKDYIRMSKDSPKYQELLMAVQSKFPGESRHETALRYIREREHKITMSNIISRFLNKKGR